MERRDKDIRIKVIYDGNEYQLETYPDEYRSLMALIYDNIFTEDFGECRGMGRCGTCLIGTPDNVGELGTFDRNEAATIKKMGVTDPSVRLACQIPVSAALNGIEIRII